MLFLRVMESVHEKILLRKDFIFHIRVFILEDSGVVKPPF